MECGRVEASIVQHQGPPARVAADWLGDRVLTCAGEILNSLSGRMVGKLSLGEGGGGA